MMALQIEARLNDIERGMDRLINRMSEISAAPRIRLGKTAENPNTAAYPNPPAEPTDANVNTYWVKFVEGTFTGALTNEGATYTDRQADAPFMAHCPCDGLDRYFPEGTFVFLVFSPGDGKWWILPNAHLATFIIFATSETFTHNDFNFDITVVSYFQGWDPDPTSAGLTIYNLQTHTPGVYLFEGGNGWIGMAVYDDRTNKYICIQIECPP